MFTDSQKTYTHMCIRFLVFICIVLFGIYCTDSKKNPVDSGSESPEYILGDTVSLYHSIDTLSTMLADADRASIKSMMTESALEMYSEALDSLSDKELETIANALDHNEITTKSPVMVEYGFTIDGLTYTIALTPGQSEESWRIVQF